jgi:hypothetical protein
MDSRREPTDSSSESTSSPTSSGSTSAERERAVAAIIAKMHFALGREIPTKEERNLMAGAWLEILDPVPTEDLQTSYVFAMRTHDGAALLGAQEIARAYEQIQANRLKALPAPVPAPLSEGFDRWAYWGRIADISRRAASLNAKNPHVQYVPVTHPPPAEWMGRWYGRDAEDAALADPEPSEPEPPREEPDIPQYEDDDEDLPF